jgi:hypothetical protein
VSQQIYSSAGTYNWTAPAGVTSVDLILIGAGADYSGGNGGGGGAFIQALGVSVSPGTTYTIVVGNNGTPGADTTWESTIFVAGGGQNNAGGTASGSGTPTYSSQGGSGGTEADCTGDVCDSCDTTCDQYDCTSYDQTCDNPPDCTSYSSNGNCNGYGTTCLSSHDHCNASHSEGPCGYVGGGGSSGTLSGYSDAGSAGCGGGGTSCGGTAFPGCSGYDGYGGTAPTSPGGNGGDPGANATGNGGGGGGSGGLGTDGYAQLDFSAVYNEVGSGGVVVDGSDVDSLDHSNAFSEVGSGGMVANSSAINQCRFSPVLAGGLLADSVSLNICRFNSNISGGVVVDGSATVTSTGSVGKANLEHYYTLDANSSTQHDSVRDDTDTQLSSQRNVGGADSVTGIIGNAQYGEMANQFSISSNGFGNTFQVDDRDWTYSTWIKADDWSSDHTIFNVAGFSHGWYANEAQNYGGNLHYDAACQLFYDHTSNRFKFTFLGNDSLSGPYPHTQPATTVTASTFGAPSTGVWIHIVVWFDKANQQIGIQVNGQANTASHTYGGHFCFDVSVSPVARIIMGGSAALGFSGAYDEIGWWSRVLTDAERSTLYNAGAGKAFSTFVAQSNAWVELGHGGCVADGSAANWKGGDITASGGELANSTSTPKAIYNVSTAGGGVCDGSAIVTTRYANINASGGVVVDGNAQTANNYVQIASGGVKANSSAGNTCVFNSNIPSGGVVLDSTADVSGHRTYNDVGGGGIVCNSSAVNHLRFNVKGSKGIVCAGNDTDFVYQGSGRGGIVCGGSASFAGSLTHAVATLATDIHLDASDYFAGNLDTVTITTDIHLDVTGHTHFQPVISGGAKLGTSAKVNDREARAASGGVVVDGSAKIGRKLNNVPTGGIVGDSTAVNRIQATQNGSGGLKAGTSAKVSSNQAKPASGGVKAGGAAKVSARSPRTALGGLKANSSARVEVRAGRVATLTTFIHLNALPHYRFKPLVTGGTVADGSSKVGRILQLENGIGGAKCGGVCLCTIRAKQVASGGCVADGQAKQTQRFKQVASGGLLGNSQAKVSKTYVNRGAGGAVAGTSASVSSREARRSTGGVKAGGAATAIRTIHATATLTTDIHLEAQAYQFIVDALVAYLKTALTPHSFLLGTSAAPGVYAYRAPQRKPANWVVVSLISNTHWRGLRWLGGCAMGVANGRIQIDVFGDDCQSIAKTIRPLVNAYSGSWGDVPIISTGSLKVIDGDQFQLDGSPNLMRRRIIDLQVVYRESRPLFAGTVITTTEDIETSLESYLSDLAPIYRGGFPQALNAPAIAWKKTDENDFYGLGEVFDFVSHEYHLTIRAKRESDCVMLANRVRNRLDGLTGQLANTLCAEVALANESTSYATADEGSDKAFYFLEQTYTLLVQGENET